MSVTAAEKNWECSQDILTILDLESSASASLRAEIQVSVLAVQGSSWVRQGRKWICWALMGRSPWKCGFIGTCSTPGVLSLCRAGMSHLVTAGPLPSAPLICRPNTTKTPNPNPYQLPKLFPAIPHAWDPEDVGDTSQGEHP